MRISTEWTGNLKGIHAQVCHPDQMKAFWAGVQSKVVRVRKLDHMLGLSAEPKSPGEIVFFITYSIYRMINKGQLIFFQNIVFCTDFCLGFSSPLPSLCAPQCSQASLTQKRVPSDLTRGTYQCPSIHSFLIHLSFMHQQLSTITPFESHTTGDFFLLYICIITLLLKNSLNK